MSSVKRVNFCFISSYQGAHDFQVACDGYRFRLTKQVAPPSRDFCNLSDEQFKLRCEGKVGLLTAHETLPLELAAAFTRWSYQSFMADVAVIRGNPKRYGAYDAGLYKVYLPAVYDADKGWVPTCTYEELIAAAEIPPQDCCCAQQHWKEVQAAKQNAA